MLGHASTAMTLDVYAGLFSDDLDAVADALDVLVAKPAPAGEESGWMSLAWENGGRANPQRTTPSPGEGPKDTRRSLLSSAHV